MRFLYALRLLSVLFLSNLPAFAQESKPIINEAAMRFNTRGELRQMIPANVNDLRKTFYLLVEASRKGLSQDAALQYRELWQKEPDNAVLKAEYAFSHAVAVYSSPFDKQNPEQKRLQDRLNQYNQEAERCRAEALAALPNSPEVLIMTARGNFFGHPPAQSVALSEKAVKLDPKWSLAHYWLGYSLVTVYGPTNLPNKTAGLLRAVSELQQSETLDPSTKNGNILSTYIHAYNGLKQYDKALFYINRCLEVNARTGGSAKARKALLQWKAAAEKNLAAMPKTASPKP